MHGFRRETEVPTIPELILTTPLGGTVHTYPITGGKTTFVRHLACYLGSCRFCNDLEEATDHLKQVEPISEIQFRKQSIGIYLEILHGKCMTKRRDRI